MRHIILSIIVFICLAKNNASGQYWSSLGPGLGDTYNAPTVHALLLHNGELYAAGYFNLAGGQPANNIAKWNGSNWSPLGSGIENFGVHCLEVYNGEVYAGGYITMAGGLDIIGLAKWDGNSWSSVGGSLQYGAVHAMEVHDGSLYIAGSFTQVGGIAAKNIARWDGSSWSALGLGINGGVYALESYNGSLFAGGGITSAGGLSVSKIAKWDGNSWSSPGAGFDGTVYTLCAYNNALYAGGSFLYSGPDPTKFIAKWNGTTWSGLGSGVNDPVHSLYSFDSYLYAGGGFNMAGTTPANGIAKWNGITWSGLGEGTGHAHAITADSGAVYAAGSFIMAGNATVNAVAKWTEQCNSVPPQPGIISGDNTICAGSTQTFSITPVTNAASYLWTIPTGWIGTSNTNTITCIAGTSGGDITVVARNPCGNSIVQTLQVDVSGTIPAQPAVIIGNDSVCYGSTETFFTDPIPGVTSYTWTLPYDNYWQGNSTTNTITAYVGEWGGYITVVANNDYCSSNPQTLLVSVTYYTPSQPESIFGNKFVCPNSSQTYSIAPVFEATGYTWTLPAGWTGSSTTSSITVTPGSSGGNISVVANNRCGSSAPTILEVEIDNQATPPQPNNIYGKSSVCQNTTQSYSVNPVNGASSYTWVLPSGWIGSSNTNSIDVIIGNASGIISVSASNGCGASIERALAVRVDTFLTNPDEITGKIFVLVNQKDTYSINQVNGAAGYSWSVSGGGAIVTGQNTNSVIINWTTPGEYILTVNTSNSCGPSASRSLSIKVSEVNQEDPYSIQLFPNPSHGEFYLKAKRVQDKWLSVEVVSMSGQFMYHSGKILGSNNYSMLIDLDKMSTGLYVVRIVVNDQVFIRKMAIVR